MVPVEAPTLPGAVALRFKVKAPPETMVKLPSTVNVLVNLMLLPLGMLVVEPELMIKFGKVPAPEIL